MVLSLNFQDAFVTAIEEDDRGDYYLVLDIKGDEPVPLKIKNMEHKAYLFKKRGF